MAPPEPLTQQAQRVIDELQKCDTILDLEPLAAIMTPRIRYIAYEEFGDESGNLLSNDLAIALLQDLQGKP